MMDCDLAIELLPWLLNGTLETGERQEVLAHLRSCAGCRAALADTRTAWEIFDWHPETAALVAHASGGAEGADGAGGAGGVGGAGDARGARGAEDAQDIEEHLATCPKCAAELELVRTSRLLADPASPADDARFAILPRPREATGSGEAVNPVNPGNPINPTSPTPLTPRRSPLAARRDDAAARRAWRRSALAASLVGALAATGWLQSAHRTHDLEQRLAATTRSSRSPAPPASAVAAPPPPARGEASDLKRRTGEAEARLAALAQQNRQLQRQVADLDRTAAALSQRSAALAAPQPAAAPRIESDVMVSDLAPLEQTERGAGAPAAAAVPLSSGAATLLLHTRHRGSYQSYELEVRDAQGRLVGAPARVLRLPGSQDSLEEFDITLRRGALAPGTYTLHLYGRPERPGAVGSADAAENQREPLETYSIRVS